jgi:hypothetical protein
MVRNKSQSQEGLNDSRLENLGDNRQNSKTPNREQQDDDQRQNARKNHKGASTRKGSPGKNNRS